ncbi:MAG: hypothetical protein EZS28_013827 [Streblomastix strix]|uniref:Uncharacterized protein n=1 Tax=Streblomastix strix TaxID=222440 RepID=A0A5J4W707_9EUKA|nr:MAG: hypothetical protein EZS28_013827 [Streblomastix strix]
MKQKEKQNDETNSGLLLTLQKDGLVTLWNVKSKEKIAKMQPPFPMGDNPTLMRDIVDTPYRLATMSGDHKIIILSERCAPRILVIQLPTDIQILPSFPASQNDGIIQSSAQANTVTYNLPPGLSRFNKILELRNKQSLQEGRIPNSFIIDLPYNQLNHQSLLKLHTHLLARSISQLNGNDQDDNSQQDPCSHNHSNLCRKTRRFLQHNGGLYTFGQGIDGDICFCGADQANFLNDEINSDIIDPIPLEQLNQPTQQSINQEQDQKQEQELEYNNNKEIDEIDDEDQKDSNKQKKQQQSQSNKQSKNRRCIDWCESLVVETLASNGQKGKKIVNLDQFYYDFDEGRQKKEELLSREIEFQNKEDELLKQGFYSKSGITQQYQKKQIGDPYHTTFNEPPYMNGKYEQGRQSQPISYSQTSTVYSHPELDKQLNWRETSCIWTDKDIPYYQFDKDQDYIGQGKQQQNNKNNKKYKQYEQVPFSFIHQPTLPPHPLQSGLNSIDKDVLLFPHAPQDVKIWREEEYDIDNSNDDDDNNNEDEDDEQGINNSIDKIQQQIKKAMNKMSKLGKRSGMNINGQESDDSNEQYIREHLVHPQDLMRDEMYGQVIEDELRQKQIVKKLIDELKKEIERKEKLKKKEDKQQQNGFNLNITFYFTI